MYLWFYVLLLGAINSQGIHSFAVGSTAEIEQSRSLKKATNQTTDAPFPKVRQVDDSVISSDREILKGVIDDQTTHLFFGEADSVIAISDIGVGRGFPANAFGTLLPPIKQQVKTENAADLPVVIFTTHGPSDEIQTGTLDVRISDSHPQTEVAKPIGNPQVANSVIVPVHETEPVSIISPVVQVPGEVDFKKIAGDVIITGELHKPSPQFQVSQARVSQIQQETHLRKFPSLVTESTIDRADVGRQAMTSDHLIHAQETEIYMDAAVHPMMAHAPGELNPVLMEHKGDFALELNPITKEGVNVRSQTATSLNLPAGARQFPMFKVKQVFTIRVPPSVPTSPLPMTQWKVEDSSDEIVLDHRAPIQLVQRQLDPQMPMTSRIAQVEDVSVAKIDSFALEDIAQPAYFHDEANVNVDGILVEDKPPTVVIIDQPSLTDLNSGVFVSATEEDTPNDKDVDFIISIPVKTNFDPDSILFRSRDGGGTRTKTVVDQVSPFQSETNLRKADDIVIDENREQTQVEQEHRVREAARNADATGSTMSEIEEGIEMTSTTGFQVAGHHQPTDKQNPISDERAMRSAFASIISGIEQPANSHTQRPINIQIDRDADEPNVSIEVIGVAPIQHDRDFQTAIRPNRTVLIELDDGFASTEVVGQIDANQTIHLPQANEEQQVASTKAPRRAGNRQGGKSRTVTIEQIQRAANEKHSDEVQDDFSVERTTKPNNGNQQSSRDSNEQDDHSLEVNFRLLSKMKRIMTPEWRKQEKRPSMVFFRHSEEDNDASLELNNMLANPFFQQKMQEIDGRLRSAPEARGKRLMEKYAEALATSSNSSSLIINSLLPFFIAWVLICW